MLCPRCPSGILTERKEADVIIDLCADCGGMWLDRGEFERLAAHGPRRIRDEDYDDNDIMYSPSQGRWVTMRGHPVN